MASLRLFGILVVVAGCSVPPVKGPARGSSDEAVAHASHFPEARAGRVRSRSLDLALEFMLPEKAAWSVADGPIWFEAEQRESSSKLALRTWRAERLVRRSDCAARARLARSTMPIVREESVVEQRAFAAPAGFDSELVVGVEPSAAGVAGYAIVIGAAVGYCYAAVFTTTASGSDADQEVAARLAIAVERILGGVRTRSVDERAVRRRLAVSRMRRLARHRARASDTLETLASRTRHHHGTE